MAAKKVSREKEVKTQETELTAKPKKLSKAGEWMEKKPKGFMIIHDMRAVMR
ncbi:MAG: hypothetical protein LBC70_00180 [Chitinispirillales bacterium]|jgi:hypothetical protein|nr:hypothetical protein [Chitinispirillales bacterium]